MEEKLILKVIEAHKKLNSINTTRTNMFLRNLIGLKSVKSSLPLIQGSRFMFLENAHQPFGLTSRYASQTINLLTCHINSTEYDEDICTLNKEVSPKIISIVRQKIPPTHTITIGNKKHIKKGELLAKPLTPNELPILAKESGDVTISGNTVEIRNVQNIDTGVKIQNLYGQKYILKKELDRYKFVSIEENPVTKETIKTLEEVGLKPITIDLTNIGKPALTTGSNSIFKRQSSGHLACLWLGMRTQYFNDNSVKTEFDWNQSKEVYITKIYDSKYDKYFDAIVGIVPWLVSITSGTYITKIPRYIQRDFIGRYDGVSIDPFGYYVLKLFDSELADTLLKAQLYERIEAIKKFFKQNNLL